MIIYGQRTVDDRIAFGGRGAPYHFGSRVRPAYDHVPRCSRHCATCWSSSSPLWAAEPLRWLGINAGLRAMTWADHREARTGRPSRLASGFERFVGG